MNIEVILINLNIGLKRPIKNIMDPDKCRLTGSKLCSMTARSSSAQETISFVCDVQCAPLASTTFRHEEMENVKRNSFEITRTSPMVITHAHKHTTMFFLFKMDLFNRRPSINMHFTYTETDDLLFIIINDDHRCGQDFPMEIANTLRHCGSTHTGIYTQIHFTHLNAHNDQWLVCTTMTMTTTEKKKNS